MSHKIFHTIMSKLIGFVIFLIVLGLTNYVADYLPAVSRDIVHFFNQNILLLFLITIILMIGEALGLLAFPFNMAAPIFNAIGSVFLVTFIFTIIIFFNSLIGVRMRIPIHLFSFFTSIFVFVMVIIVGYVKIFTDIGKHAKKKTAEVKKPSKETKKKSEVQWSDVGEEFKMAMYELAKSLRRAASGKKK